MLEECGLVWARVEETVARDAGRTLGLGQGKVGLRGQVQPNGGWFQGTLQGPGFPLQGQRKQKVNQRAQSLSRTANLHMLR